MSRPIRRAARALLLLLACALAQLAAARTVLDLDLNAQPVPLADWADVWVDPTGTASASDVAKPGTPWRPAQLGEIFRLEPGHALWFRFTIPPAPDAERWYLEVPSPAVDSVTLYAEDSIGQWQPQRAGDRIPVAEWPIPHRHPLLPVAVSAEEPHKHLVRVDTPRYFGASLRFISESYLAVHEQRAMLVHGLYLGLAALAALVALLAGVSLRDAALAACSAVIASMALTQATLLGIAGAHLWPYSPVWNDFSPFALPILVAGVSCWTLPAIGSLHERSRPMAAVTVALVALAPVAIGAAWLAGPQSRHLVMTGYVLVCAAVGLGALSWLARRGDRYAPWVLVSLAPVLLGAAFPLVKLFGASNVNFWTEHAVEIGTALHWPALLFILGVRSQSRREAARRIQALGRADPATGLFNEDEFRKILLNAEMRAKRLETTSAVFVVELLNAEQLSAEFGKRAAALMPVYVAARLLAMSRYIDTVARLGENRFAVLMDGPLNREEAMAFASRMVAICLRPMNKKPVSFVAKVQVAYAFFPGDGFASTNVLDRLITALAGNARSSQHRAIVRLQGAATTPTAVEPATA